MIHKKKRQLIKKSGIFGNKAVNLAEVNSIPTLILFERLNSVAGIKQAVIKNSIQIEHNVVQRRFSVNICRYMSSLYDAFLRVHIHNIQRREFPCGNQRKQPPFCRKTTFFQQFNVTSYNTLLLLNLILFNLVIVFTSLKKTSTTLYTLKPDLTHELRWSSKLTQVASRFL